MQKQSSGTPFPPRKRTRGPRRIASFADRAYYRRREICERFGLSDKRLAELVESDPDLPMIRNGRNQLFPKLAFENWYQLAGTRRTAVGPAS